MKKIILSFMVCMMMTLVSCGMEEDNSSANLGNESAQSDETETTEVDEISVTDDKEETGEFSSFESVDLDGNLVTQDVLADSKVTMINIWGTFCGPCIHEMPDLGEISQEYDSSELQIIGIVTDVYNEDGVAEAKEIVESTGANYLHLLPTEDLVYGYLQQVAAIPETVFVDGEGNILRSEIGAKSKEDWQNVIDEVLNELD